MKGSTLAAIGAIPERLLSTAQNARQRKALVPLIGASALRQINASSYKSVGSIIRRPYLVDVIRRLTTILATIERGCAVELIDGHV